MAKIYFRKATQQLAVSKFAPEKYAAGANVTVAGDLKFEINSSSIPEQAPSPELDPPGVLPFTPFRDSDISTDGNFPARVGSWKLLNYRESGSFWDKVDKRLAPQSISRGIKTDRGSREANNLLDARRIGLVSVVRLSRVAIQFLL